MEKDRPVVPTYCYFQGCYNPAYEREIERGKDLCFRFNFQVQLAAPLRQGGADRYPFHESIAAKYGNVTKCAVYTRLSLPRKHIDEMRI